jgi:hypothetical protein
MGETKKKELKGKSCPKVRRRCSRRRSCYSWAAARSLIRSRPG